MNNNSDNLIKNECNQIKSQIKPSDELIDKTILKVRKVQEERTYKKQKTKKLLTKVLGTFTTVVILAEGATFAFKKQTSLDMLFSTIDKGIETALEYGNIKNVDMDYIEIENGLKVKAEFALMNEYNLDLVLKFSGIEEYCSNTNINNINQILLKDLEVTDNFENCYTFHTISPNYISSYLSASSLKLENDVYYILHCYNENNSFPATNIENINISFSEISIDNYYLKHDINFNIEFNNLNLDNNSTNFEITNKPDYIENYNIVLSSTNLKVELFFNTSSSINKDSVYLKDNNRNIYYPNNNFSFRDDYILFVFPISNYQEIENLKLNFEINNNKEKLKLTKQS